MAPKTTKIFKKPPKSEKSVVKSKKVIAEKKITIKKRKTVVKASGISEESKEKITHRTLEAPVVDTTGKKVGTVKLPLDLFGVSVNRVLLSQAVRAYLANQREGSASTKTRGEVTGSTRKIYRQKGTGRARHGGIRAPIFVGGGIAFGPKPRDYSLHMPRKMRRAALASALTSQYVSGNMTFVTGMNAIAPKTKLMNSVLNTIGKKGKTLLIVEKEAKLVVRAARNIEDLEILPAQNVNAYEVLRYNNIIMMKEALAILPGRNGEL